MWCKNCGRQIEKEAGKHNHVEPAVWYFVNSGSYGVETKGRPFGVYCTAMSNGYLIAVPDHYGKPEETSVLYDRFFDVINEKRKFSYNINKLFTSYNLKKLDMWGASEDMKARYVVSLIVDYEAVVLEVKVNGKIVFVFKELPMHFPKVEVLIKKFDEEVKIDEIIENYKQV